jgi:hypothetical protein
MGECGTIVFKVVLVELFVTGTGAGISGANTGGTGTGIFPCQRPTPRGEAQRWTGELRRGVGGRGRLTCRPRGAAQVTPARSALHCSTAAVKQETKTFSSFFCFYLLLQQIHFENLYNTR